jgi:hypothetical protein
VENNYRGLGFWGSLQLALIILKLCNIIKWSWIAVFTPTIIGVTITLLIIIYFIFITRRKK